MRPHVNRFWQLTSLMFLLAFLQLPALNLNAADLVQQYDFNGNLKDTLGNGDDLVVYPNTASYGYGTSEFWWTANSDPGGGLILDADLADPQSYSLGFRIKFNEVGPSWKKIVSFKGADEDNGLYFYDNQLQFWPYDVSTAVTFSPDVFYDFVFSRSADDVIRVYVVEDDGTVTKVYEEDDSSDNSVPINVSGKYQFMLFMDDDATSVEWSTGGTVEIIRVWNGPLSEEEIADALADAITQSATDITYTSATLNGIVNPKNLETVVTFEYGIDDTYGNQLTAEQSPVTGSTNQDVSATVSGLLPGTIYHFRVKATNSAGTAYGGDRTFTTLNIEPPTVTTAPVSDITQNSAICGGEVTSSGGATVTAYGVCWSTSPNPTTADNKTVDGSGEGSFSSSITGLTPNTTYHVRAYATNSAGTAYGSDVEFRTSPPPQPVPAVNEWGLVILASLLLITVVLFARPRSS